MIDLNALRHDIIANRLSRRDVLRRGIALGLSAPVIASLLAACGGDDDDDSGGDATESESGSGSGDETATEAESTEAESSGTEAEGEATGADAEETEGESTSGEGESSGERGGHGDLRLLWWQAPTILNTHYANGTKDQDASRLILEPLLGVNDDGSLFPVLAAEVPSYENGGLSEDGLTATIKLRQGVKWHDGEDFNAEDVKFTYEWIVSEGNAPTTLSSYLDVESVEIVDDYTVTLTFKDVNPAWMNSMIERVIPEHIMKDYMGSKGVDAPFNLNPIGTGPYKLKEFKPGDVVNYEINMDYWDPGKPHFDTVSMKGGGDAVSAARATLQTGDVDYAWNLQIEANVLNQLSEGAEAGELLTPEGVGMERIILNFADPRQEVDGAFSEPSTQHPWQSDKAVREAYKLLCDRDTIAEQLYGPAGVATNRYLVAPEKFVSDNTEYEFNPEKAAATLDEAGWVLDGDVRAKDGVEIGILYQTSINSLRQKTQEIVKQAFESVGMPVEIKAVDSAVFFTTDAGNPDNLAHFYADIQMYTTNLSSPYPIEYCAGLASLDPAINVAQKANSWGGENTSRWQSEEFNEIYSAARVELDEAKQAELFVQMNDLVVEEGVHIPLVLRADVSAKSKTVDVGERSRWQSELYNIADWTRIEG